MTAPARHTLDLSKLAAALTVLARWRDRPLSPRRARAMYEAQRLRFLAEDLDRENARRERERNRPCPFCVAAGLIPADQPAEEATR